MGLETTLWAFAAFAGGALAAAILMDAGGVVSALARPRHWPGVVILICAAALIADGFALIDLAPVFDQARAFWR